MFGSPCGRVVLGYCWLLGYRAEFCVCVFVIVCQTALKRKR